MSTQIPLQFRLHDSATFDNFWPGPNVTAVRALEACAGLCGEPFLYLWGRPGTGKTHLLQAICHRVAAHGATSTYVPLSRRSQLSPALFDALEQCAVICVDDLTHIAGLDPWETALFHLYNRARDAGARLVVASGAGPAGLNLGLADLASRLAWGPVFRLHELGDADKRSALQLRARTRGLELPAEVADYLLRRYAREPAALFGLLDRLDRASLIRQRRITIPFARELIESHR